MGHKGRDIFSNDKYEKIQVACKSKGRCDEDVDKLCFGRAPDLEL